MPGLLEELLGVPFPIGISCVAKVAKVNGYSLVYHEDRQYTLHPAHWAGWPDYWSGL
jgi:hypothetical protein